MKSIKQCLKPIFAKMQLQTDKSLSQVLQIHLTLWSLPGS